MEKKLFINNAESHNSPNYLKISKGNENPIRVYKGHKQRRHYVGKTWGISRECPTYFKFSDTIINRHSYKNPFMNEKSCRMNERVNKFRSFT